jgi:hypothetical protein
MIYNALEIETPWVKKHRSFNAQLIPKKLQELAKAGTYFDSKLIPLI